MSLTAFGFKKTLFQSRKAWFEKSRRLSFCAETQEKTLLSLLHHARNTQFGLDYQFLNIKSIKAYQNAVPIRTYEDFFNDYFRPASEKAAKQYRVDYNPNETSPYLQNIIWPCLIPFFSLSSGTTSGKTKFIPLTRELIRANRCAAIDLTAFHFLRKPQSKVLDGKTFLLGGNLELRKAWHGKVESGDLSGVLARQLPFFCRHLYFPGEKIGRISDWEEKMEQAAEAGLTDNLTTLGGVPSWILLFLTKLNQKRNFKGDITKIWPFFELLVHGGISFDPYREQFREWLGGGVYFQEVYPSSEAFIAIEDPRERALRLMIDYGIFYEFVPAEELGNKKPARLTLAEIETGQNYAIVLTTNGGLWSYLLGDTVRFLSKEPPLLKMTGRTKFSLSAFGEHLIQEEIETALQKACLECNAQWVDYHVAPLYPSSVRSAGCHQYLIEFARSPKDIKGFVNIFDRALQKLNEDYAAHRTSGYGMTEPEFTSVPQDFFNTWMKRKGKMGAQNKVPRISGNRDLIEDMLNFQKQCVTNER